MRFGWWLLRAAIILTLVLGASQRAHAAEELSSEEAGRLYRAGGAEGSVVEAYAAGLTHGAYVTYIFELTGGGLTGQVARAIAEKRCGYLTGNQILEVAAAKMPKIPLRVAAPALVHAVCHSKDMGS